MFEYELDLGVETGSSILSSTSGADRDHVQHALASYELEGEIGRGACGVVVGARHRQLGRLVAIKQLPRPFVADPGVRSRFIAEARLLATLDHPHVVPIYDFVQDEGLCLLVMERLSAGSVRSRFANLSIRPDVSCAIMLAVCAALQHAHDHGVLHRDVKPENLLFSTGQMLKVTDFGIAKVIGGSATLATRAGEVLGTPAYMAPEQAQGLELSRATDVYAAATVLYELLAGTLPFPMEGTPAAVLYRHVYERPMPLIEAAPALPVALTQVVDRGLAAPPLERYQSAEEFGVAIAESAAQIWGPGWLARTKMPVSAGGAILAAALGKPSSSSPSERSTSMPNWAAGDRWAFDSADLVPIEQLHPELRGSPIPAGIANRSADLGAQVDAGPAAPGGSISHPTEMASQSTILHPSNPPGWGSPAPPSAPPPAPPAAPPPPPAAAAPPPPPAAPPLFPSVLLSPASGKRSFKRPMAIGLAVIVVAGAVGLGVALLGSGGHPAKSSAARIGPAQPIGTSIPLPAGTWRTLKTASPTARQQVASTVANGKLWVMGGLDSDTTATAKVESYDPAVDLWSTETPLPQPLHHAMAATDKQGEVVVMGGWVPSGPNLEGSVSDQVFVLRNGTWAQLPSLHHARAAGAAAAVGDKIVVVGGRFGQQEVTQTEEFDGTGWKDVAPLPTVRDHLAAVSDGTYLYAVGGRVLGTDHNQTAAERFDPKKNQWTYLPALPTARGDLGAAVVSNHIVVLGGESPTGLIDTVDALDLATLTWNPLTPMQTPRHGMAVLFAAGTVFALDGTPKTGHVGSVTTAEAVDLGGATGSLTTWRTLPSSHVARQQVASAFSGGYIWVLGGLTNSATSTGATARVEAYDPGSQAWSDSADLPEPLHHAMAANDGEGDLVVMGGWIPTGSDPEGTVTAHVWEKKPFGWQPLPPLNHARAAGAAVTIGGKIFLIGGQANGKSVTQTEEWDGNKWTDVADLSPGRDHLAAVTDGTYLYAVGGRSLGPAKSMTDIDRYDPGANTWTKVTDLPTPTGDLGAILANKRITVVGGEGPSSVLATVEQFDLSTGMWTQLPPMHTPRHGMAVIFYGNAVYAIDGAAAPGHTASVNLNEAFFTP